MKARSLAIQLVAASLILGAGLSAFAQGQHGGGNPPGGPGGAVGRGGQPDREGQGAQQSGQQGGKSSGASQKTKGSTASSDSVSQAKTGPPRSSVQFGPVGRWWDNKSVVQTVGISTQQQKQMDTIFDANKPAILASYKTFLSQQAKLQALNKNPNVDKASLFAAIDAVNQARSDLQKTTAQMLLEIRQQMAPDQVQKLEQLP